MFWFAADQDESHHALGTPRGRLALLDLRSWTVHVPPDQPPPPADRLRYPGLQRLCWQTGPDPGLFVFGVSNDQWYRVDFDYPQRLQKVAREPDVEHEPVVEDDNDFVMYAPARRDDAKNPAAPGRESSPDCQPPQFRYWLRYVRSTHRPEITRGLRVENGRSWDSVSLVTEDGRRLAHHEVGGLLDYNVDVSAYVWSPHGQWLGYYVRAMWGSLAKPQHIFLVTRDGRRRLGLEGHVMGFHWISDELLLGCVEDAGYSGENVVQYWQLPVIDEQ